MNENSSTPILDLLKDPDPIPVAHRWLARTAALPVTVLFITGFGVGGLWFIPAVCAALCIHEAGQLVVAAAARVPLPVGGSATWRFLQRWVYAKLGGPTSFRPNLPPSIPRMFLATTGGLLSTIALAALSAVAAGRITGPLFPTLFVAAILVILALLIAAGRRNIGTLLWLAIRRPARFRSFLAWFALAGQDAAGVRPRDQDQNLLALALAADPSTREYGAACITAFYRDVDLRDFESALNHIEGALEAPHLDSIQRGHVWFEAAWASAALRQSPTQARIWLERSRTLGKLPYEKSVQAEIARSEGHYLEAAEHFAASRAQLLKEKLDTGVTRLALDWYTAAEGECRAAHSAN